MHDLGSRFYDPVLGRFLNADDVDVLEVQDDLYDKNLYAYCDNDPVNRVDEGGELWQFAVAGGTAGAGSSLAAIGSSVMAGIGSITPVGWAVIGTVIVVGVISVGIKYSKSKPKAKNKAKNETEDESSTKERENKPIAKRHRYNSRKKAKQAAQRAGKGKTPKSHYRDKNGSGPHFHPDVKNPYRVTPKGISFHDHYFYPK